MESLVNECIFIRQKRSESLNHSFAVRQSLTCQPGTPTRDFYMLRHKSEELFFREASVVSL